MNRMTIREQFKAKEFGFQYDHPKDFITLQLGHTWLYMVWSSCWTAYHLIWLCVDAYLFSLKSTDEPGRWLVYLTNLGYLVLVLQCLLDFLLACNAHLMNRDGILDGRARYMPILFRVSWVLLNVSNTTGVLLMITYWVKLAKVASATSINKHGINALYILLVLMFTAKPIKPQHVYLPMVFTVFYALLTIIYAGAGGQAIYPFLDWSDSPGSASGLILAYICVLVPIVHFSLYGLYRLRCFIAKKLNRDDDYRQTDEETRDENLNISENLANGYSSSRSNII